jgi:signal transduction histidine kinase
MIKQTLRIYRVAVLPWTVHWLAFGTLLWFSNYFYGRSVQWIDSMRFTLPSSALWLAFTPLAVGLARRVRLRRSNPLPGLLVLIGAGLVLHVVISLGQYAFVSLIATRRPNVRLVSLLADWSVTDLVRFGVIVGATKAYDFERGRRAARRAASRLRASLAEAELELLHLRLQPHFLFNALQAISELVHVDPARADRAIVAMGELLRRGLAGAGRPIVPLAEELEALDAYVDLERLRRTQPFDFTLDVPRDTLSLGVPNFALQPLVENALRHGLGGRARGRVSVHAFVEDGTLTIEIADDGAGPVRGAPLGRGLSNVRDRLVRLNGGIEMEPRPAGGTIVRMWLPAQTVAALETRESA